MSPCIARRNAPTHWHRWPSRRLGPDIRLGIARHRREVARGADEGADGRFGARVRLEARVHRATAELRAGDVADDVRPRPSRAEAAHFATRHENEANEARTRHAPGSS